MTLFSELKRRNVLRVVAAYVAVGWLLIQVVETLFPVFGLSDAAIRGVVIVLAIGFVPAVIVAWAFELTPDGLVRDSEVDRGSETARASTKRLDRIVMVALALAVGYFAFDKFMLDPARDQAIAEAAREEGRADAAQASRDAGPPVVAVLPFTAVTDTEDSVFFAAGVHDDLLTKLAQLPSMLVISRTSVLEYKDVQRNMREIGEELGADGRKSISQLGTTDDLIDKDAILSVALLAAIEGETEETERLVQSWYRGGARDLAGRSLNWDKACRALGIAGAAEAAVKCIREGLEIPSAIMPFFEHHQPQYDPIRDEPVFVELVEELAN